VIATGYATTWLISITTRAGACFHAKAQVRMAFDHRSPGGSLDGRARVDTPWAAVWSAVRWEARPDSSLVGHEPPLTDLSLVRELLNEAHLPSERLHELHIKADSLERVVGQLHAEHV
jgi:hypothetical protein